MVPKLDRTILGIVALALATGGALTILTNANVPRVNQTFYGTNLFATKRDAIQETMAWLFAGMTLLGVLIQACAYVVHLPDRAYRPPTYFAVSATSVAAVLILLWLVTQAGFAIARRQWLPDAVEGSRDMLRMTEMLIRNDGLEDSHLVLRPDDPQRQELRIAGHQRIAEYLAQMEDLLDMKDRSGSPDQRLDRIKPVLARQ
jgi:hypothetical protein